MVKCMQFTEWPRGKYCLRCSGARFSVCSCVSPTAKKTVFFGSLLWTFGSLAHRRPLYIYTFSNSLCTCAYSVRCCRAIAVRFMPVWYLLILWSSFSWQIFACISFCHAVMSVAGICTGRYEPRIVRCADAQKFAEAGGEMELILYTC